MDTLEKHLPSTERHPLDPFLPEGARILMLGSFPPKKERWSMDFFYPNFINDMWRIVGHIFFGNKDYFLKFPANASGNGKTGTKPSGFDKDRITEFCTGKGIALYDTACEVRRLKDNASDKFLEVVTPSDIPHLLSLIPECRAIVTTGQKATDVIAETFGCRQPAVGGMTEFTVRIPGTMPAEAVRTIRFWRMPSSSRAYPMAMEKKAEYYRAMYRHEGLLEVPQVTTTKQTTK